MIQEDIIPLRNWQDGDQDLYQKYTDIIANGGVYQEGNSSFWYRTNLRFDITKWLSEECPPTGLLRVNDRGYISRVEFDTKDGAMLFKLKWVI